MGGSTTEGLFIDDEKSSHYLIENILGDHGIKAEIFNAGKSGDIVVDHIAMLVHRIIHLQPDCIVLLAGINDLLRYNYDYLHHYQHPAPPEISYLNLLLSNFQIYRRFYWINKKPSIEEITLSSNYREKAEITLNLPSKTMLNNKRHKRLFFETNLRTFIGILKAHNIDLILVTQATTWGNENGDSTQLIKWMNFIGPYRYPETALKEELDYYNSIIRNLAKEFEIYLFDLALEIEISDKYFYDDCHFNNYGAQIYARNISKLILLKLNQ